MPPEPRVALRAVQDGVEFSLKVTPNASRNKIAGVWNEALRIAVAAPPEDGKANREVERFLASELGVKRQSVSIVSGHTASQKRVRVSGVDVETLSKKLETALA